MSTISNRRAIVVAALILTGLVFASLPVLEIARADGRTLLGLVFVLAGAAVLTHRKDRR